MLSGGGKAGFRDNSQQDLYKDAPIWDEGLTGRRRLFVEYYCGDKSCFLNAVKSYSKAYNRPDKELSETSIQSNSSRLLRDPKIKDAIARLLRSMQNEEDQLSEYQTLRLLKTLTFYNPADIIDRNGGLKITNDLTELGENALCVTGIKRGRDGSMEIKLYDRTKALAMLSEYLDIIRPAAGSVFVNPNMYLAAKDLEELRREEEARTGEASEK